MHRREFGKPFAGFAALLAVQWVPIPGPVKSGVTHYWSDSAYSTEHQAYLAFAAVVIDGEEHYATGSTRNEENLSAHVKRLKRSLEKKFDFEWPKGDGNE